MIFLALIFQLLPGFGQKVKKLDRTTDHKLCSCVQLSFEGFGFYHRPSILSFDETLHLSPAEWQPTNIENYEDKIYVYYMMVSGTERCVRSLSFRVDQFKLPSISYKQSIALK